MTSKMSPSLLPSCLRGTSPTPSSIPESLKGLTSYVPPERLTTLSPRKLAKALPAIETAEGVGVIVHRAIGTHLLRHFSPFLMLDYARITAGAGFPDHPHRGQETISYNITGTFEHEDFAGNKGVLKDGDLQFMTAGKGIMHSEIPLPRDDGADNVGVQLWVDLPQHLKMCEPRYRDVKGSEVRVAEADEGRVRVKVIQGAAYGAESKLKDAIYTPVWYLDFTVKPGGKVLSALPQGWNAFAYIMDGGLEIGGMRVEKQFIATMEKEGDGFEARVPEDAQEDARFLLIAGLPLDQPIVQHGPFVMTSRSEIQQAVMDFVGHTNGFERAKSWESKHEKRRKSLSG